MLNSSFIISAEVSSGSAGEFGHFLFFTVTVYEQVAVFPAPFVTVYVTVVIPTGKVCVPTKLIPVDGELPVKAPSIVQVNEATLQLPLVIGLGVLITALHLFTPFCWLIIFAGQLIDAAVLSVTDIVNEHVAEELVAFVAVYVIVVVPILKFAVPT